MLHPQSSIATVGATSPSPTDLWTADDWAEQKRYILKAFDLVERTFAYDDEWWSAYRSAGPTLRLKPCTWPEKDWGPDHLAPALERARAIFELIGDFDLKALPYHGQNHREGSCWIDVVPRQILSTIRAVERLVEPVIASFPVETQRDRDAWFLEPSHALPRSERVKTSGELVRRLNRLADAFEEAHGTRLPILYHHMKGCREDSDCADDCPLQVVVLVPHPHVIDDGIWVVPGEKMTPLQALPPLSHYERG